MVTRTARRARERGLTLIEVTTAISLATIMAGAAIVATGEHFRFIAGSFEEAAAARAAAARLEALAAGAAPLAPGDRAFALASETAGALPGVRGEERVRARGPRLFSVEVAIVWPVPAEGRERRVALETLVAAEDAP